MLFSRTKMSSSSSLITPTPENSIVLGCGGVVVDLLAAVASYPKPDDKIRSTSFQVQGGGNAGNALTCVARLGLNPRLISKVADDAQGRGILEELEADGVNTSFIVVSPTGNSPFTYVIVDNETKTRTCIHTPGDPPMVPEDLSQSKLESALDGAKVAYFDVRLHETALVIAKEDAAAAAKFQFEIIQLTFIILNAYSKAHLLTKNERKRRVEAESVQATRRNIPILVDAEKKRDGLDELLNLATYVVCSEKFPQARFVWTEASSTPKALLSMLLKLPKVKFVIVTLGEDGCIMLERSFSKASDLKEMYIDEVVESLKQKTPNDYATPSCVSSSVIMLKADGVGAVCGRLHVGTAEKIPPSEIVDTTGAGDAFIGAVLYGILYVWKCLQKGCCHFLQKWQDVAVELWELVQVYHVTLILVFHHFCMRVPNLLGWRHESCRRMRIQMVLYTPITHPAPSWDFK
ncbi:Ketohexokinase [Bienertia sinuspersici]